MYLVLLSAALQPSAFSINIIGEKKMWTHRFIVDQFNLFTIERTVGAVQTQTGAEKSFCRFVCFFFPLDEDFDPKTVMKL